MDFEARLRSIDLLGGQCAPQATDGVGVQALYECRTCRRIWLQDGKSALLDLQPEQIERIARACSADVERLPASTCRLCLWRDGGGSVSIDEYDQGEGFGFCWEIPKPTVIHATSAILSQKGAATPDSKPDVLTQHDTLRAVLGAVKMAPPPHHIPALPHAACQLQAADLRPGFGQPGTRRWQWQGWWFPLTCAPLGGEALVTLMLALPPAERVSPASVFRTWQFLMELTLLGGIPNT